MPRKYFFGSDWRYLKHKDETGYFGSKCKDRRIDNITIKPPEGATRLATVTMAFTVVIGLIG